MEKRNSQLTHRCSQWSKQEACFAHATRVVVFKSMRGGRAIISPPAKRHLNGVSLACLWWPNTECWLGSFVFFRGSEPVLLRNPIFLWFFRGGSRPPVPPSLDPRMLRVKYLFPCDFFLLHFLLLHNLLSLSGGLFWNVGLCRVGHHLSCTHFYFLLLWKKFQQLSVEPWYVFCLIWFFTSHQLSFSYKGTGRVFLGWTSTKLGLCSCSRTQRSDASEDRTHGPSVSSQALYHWALALPTLYEVLWYCIMVKRSKIRTLFSFVFSYKMLVFRAGIHKLLARTAIREKPDQTASKEAVWSGSALFV